MVYGAGRAIVCGVVGGIPGWVGEAEKNAFSKGCHLKACFNECL